MIPLHEFIDMDAEEREVSRSEIQRLLNNISFDAQELRWALSRIAYLLELQSGLNQGDIKPKELEAALAADQGQPDCPH